MRAALIVLLFCLGGCPPQVRRLPSIAVSPVAVDLMIGATQQLTAVSGEPTETIRWASTTPTVATVDEDGLVTAIAAGSAFITATGTQTGASTFAGVVVRGGVRHESISYARDIEPLFRTGGAWYPGSAACIGCHFGGNTFSAAEMDFSSYSGLRQGSYSVTQAPGISIFGETRPNGGDFNWDNSRLKWRLTSPRMPPGMPHHLDGTGRDGPMVPLRGLSAGMDGGTDASVATDAGPVPHAPAVAILEAWVTARCPREAAFFVQGNPTTFRDGVLPLFTTANLWFPLAQNCSFCHFGTGARTGRELDLSSYDGIMAGALTVSEPPGHSILGETMIGRGDFDWNRSFLQQRLRNERMPPGWPFDRNRSWPEGPTLPHPVTGMPVTAVELIRQWVASGAPNN